MSTKIGTAKRSPRRINIHLFSNTKIALCVPSHQSWFFRGYHFYDENPVFFQKGELNILDSSLTRMGLFHSKDPKLVLKMVFCERQQAPAVTNTSRFPLPGFNVHQQCSSENLNQPGELHFTEFTRSAPHWERNRSNTQI